MMPGFIPHVEIQQIKRDARRRESELGLMEISPDGTKLAHGLRVVPKWVQLIPIMDRGIVATSWWYYQKPDKDFLYIQSSAKGKFYVTVGG